PHLLHSFPTRRSSDLVRHEIYHLLGCSEHFNMSGCYETITAMKRRKRDGGSDFFPAWDGINERTLVSRDAVNARLLEVTGAGRTDRKSTRLNSSHGSI